MHSLRVISAAGRERGACECCRAGVELSQERKHLEDFSIYQSELTSVFGELFKTLFNDTISINFTASEDRDSAIEELVFVRSRTEMALLRFAKQNGRTDYKKTRENADIVQMITFPGERKAMGFVQRLPTDDTSFTSRARQRS